MITNNIKYIFEIDNEKEYDLNDIECIILDSLTDLDQKKAIIYFIDCYNRCKDKNLEIYSEKILNYTGLALFTPSLFNYDDRIIHDMYNIFLEKKEYKDFLNQLLNMFAQQYSEYFIDRIVKYNSMKKHSDLLNLLFSCKSIVDNIIVSKYWIDDKMNGKDIEENTILGKIINNLVDDNDYKLFMQKIMQPLIISSNNSKKSILKWISMIVNKNLDKIKIEYNDNCSSDKFLVNVNVILLNLCNELKEVNEISASSILATELYDIRGETKLNGTIDDFEKFKRNNQDKRTFNSELFGITLKSMQIGFINLMEKYKNLEHTAVIIKNQLMSSSDPILIFKYQIICEELKSLTSLFKSRNISKLSDYFYIYTLRWLYYIANPKNILPFPKEAPINFKLLPLFIVDSLIEYFIFNFGYLSYEYKQLLLTFLVIFLNDDDYIDNIYSKSKFVELLTEYIDLESNIIELNKGIQNNLVETLLKFYKKTEKMGGFNQFFEKFSVRYNIGRILLYIWDMYEYKHLIILECTQMDKQRNFVDFIDSVVHDTNYLLYEAILSIKKIRDYELLTNQNEKKRKYEEHIKNEETASNVMIPAKLNLQLLYKLSSKIVKPFMDPIIISEISKMLNLFSMELAGSKSKSLDVVDSEKYGFDKNNLLLNIIYIYINFAENKEFIQAVADDERSYSDQLFTSIGILLADMSNIPDYETILYDFLKFSENVEKYAQNKKQEDIAIYDDIPDEFLDPIMDTIMMDPVLVPTSSIICDRKTILQHLLNDKTDPWTKKPLDENMLQPDIKMKDKINQWILNKKKSNK